MEKGEESWHDSWKYMHIIKDSTRQMNQGHIQEVKTWMLYRLGFFTRFDAVKISRTQALCSI